MSFAANSFVYVKGVAGLCNRLFSLGAALEYAEREGRRVFVDWSDGMASSSGENVFGDFFEVEGLVLPAEEEIPEGSCYPKPWTGRLREEVYSLYTAEEEGWRLRPEIRLSSWDRLRGRNVMPYGGSLPSGRREQVVVFVDFWPAAGRDTLLRIRLVPELQAEFDRKHSEFFTGRPSLGVAVRATDRQPRSDLDRLEELIEERRREQPDLLLYLATDNRDVKERLLSRFPGAASLDCPLPDPSSIESGGIHHRASRAEEEDAVRENLRWSILDLWLLKSCDSLLHQCNSSFHVFAVKTCRYPDRCLQWDRAIAPPSGS